MIVSGGTSGGRSSKSSSKDRNRFELPGRDDIEEGEMRTLGKADTKMKLRVDLGKRDKVEEFAGSSAREKSSSRRTKGAKERRSKTAKVKPHVETIEIHSVTSENKSIDDSSKVSGDLETLRSKVEEISAQLEEALRESEVLRRDKFRIQEKLTEKKLIEQELSTENKKLKEEVEDLSLRLEEFEKDYAELQDELDEEIDFANKIDQALGKRSVTLKRLEDENNNLQESLHEAKLAEAALLTEIEALRKREILLNNELEEYERKNYKHRFMTSEKDNKKLKEKIKGLEESLAEQHEIKAKLDGDYELSLKEQQRLQDQANGLHDVVEDLMGELNRADNIIQDYKIKEVDRTFYISQLSSELDIAYAELVKNHYENKLALEAIKCEHDENLKALSKEKEEQYNKLTDRIVGLSDVLEGTSEELRKAFDNIKDMEVKAMDQSFYISELSRELDASVDLQLKIENNCNPKLRAMWNTQVEEFKTQLRQQFGKFMRQEFEEELKDLERQKDQEIGYQKNKVDELARSLQEMQQKLEDEKQKSFNSGIHLKLKKQARTIKLLKGKLGKVNPVKKQGKKSNRRNEEVFDQISESLSISQEWQED